MVQMVDLFVLELEIFDSTLASVSQDFIDKWQLPAATLVMPPLEDRLTLGQDFNVSLMVHFDFFLLWLEHRYVVVIS